MDWVKWRERLIQGVEALLYSVLAAVGAATLDFLMEQKTFDEDTIHRMIEIARMSALSAAVLYFKTKHRDPDAHSDRGGDNKL